MNDNEKKFLRNIGLRTMEIDPLSEAEKITGVSYKDEDGLGPTNLLGLAIIQQKRVVEKNVFSALKDTYDDISWSDFLAVLTNYGFQVLENRQYRHKSSHGVKLSFIIAAHPTKYLILSATSYRWGSDDEERVNGGNVYGTIKGRRSQESREALHQCSYSRMRRFGSYLDFSSDIRSGLISKLERLGENFKFVKWHDNNRFLWLLDLNQDDDDGGEDWEKVRDRFLDEAPDWVRDFILPSQLQKYLLKIFNVYTQVKSRIHRVIYDVKHIPARCKYRKYLKGLESK